MDRITGRTSGAKNRCAPLVLPTVYAYGVLKISEEHNCKHQNKIEFIIQH